jgi:hypothetical protein
VIAKQSTAPAESLTLGGAPVLKLTCNFEGTTIPRGCWDRAVELDLTGCTAICFDVYAENILAVSSINLYLRSGDGWYGARWYPKEEGQWCRIRLPRGEFYVDKPGSGWGEIGTIRFSPWAGAREDAVLHIANFGLEDTPAPAALIVPGYSTPEGSERALTKYAATVAWLLDRAGCAMPTLSTSDLTAERLADLKLLVLPYVSRLPEEATELVAEFVRGGGKVLACYSLPQPLAELLGVSQQGFRSAQPKGEFSSMRFAEEPPPGAPQEVRQGSWGIIDSEAVEGVGRVAAWWHDFEGNRTDAPAIIISDSGAWFSHILLNDDPATKGQGPPAGCAHRALRAGDRGTRGRAPHCSDGRTAAGAGLGGRRRADPRTAELRGGVRGAGRAGGIGARASHRGAGPVRGDVAGRRGGGPARGGLLPGPDRGRG